MNCEDVLMARLAEADGEAAELSKEALLHFEQCKECRNEFAQMQIIDGLFNKQTRLQQDADVWPVIENRIVVAAGKHIGWLPFAGLAALLAGYKLLVMLSERDPGLVFKLVPLVLVVALFILIKENPFRINTALTVER